MILVIVRHRANIVRLLEALNRNLPSGGDERSRAVRGQN